MKRFLMAFITLLPLYCSAQFEQLTLFTAGSGSFSSQKSTTTDVNGSSGGTTKTSSLTFSPKVGIFVINKLLVGPVLTWTLSTSKSSGSITGSETKSRGLTVGPFVRYYIFKGLYVQGDITWGTNKTKSSSFNPYSTPTSDIKRSSKGLGLGAGYTAFLNQSKSLALDISLAYRKKGMDAPAINPISITNSDQSIFAIDIGLNGFLHLKAQK